MIAGGVPFLMPQSTNGGERGDHLKEDEVKNSRNVFVGKVRLV